MAVHRSHVDQRAAALLVHVLDARLRRQKRAVQVNGQHLLPVGERKILDRMHDLYAGIRDEDVDFAERRDRLLDAGVDLIFVGHVHGNRDGVFLAAKLLRSGLRRVEVEVCDDDTAAGCNVTLGDAVADAAGCTGDEGDFAVEFHDARSFLCIHVVVDDLAETEGQIGQDVRC